MQNEPMKTVISPEWQKEAEIASASYRSAHTANAVINNYIKGAEAYASSVERMLKDEREILRLRYNEVSKNQKYSRMSADAIAISNEIVLIDNFLLKLTTLNPL